MIPYSTQDISDEDVDAVCRTLRSAYITQGPSVTIFEDLTKRYVGAQFSVAVNSATSGLIICCRALGVTCGDWVWTVPNTFVATANCALLCGASIDFVDIDEKTYNICVQSLKQKLQASQANGTLPKALIVVHFAGQPADMYAIRDLSKRYGFKIIEDASHALGADYLDSKVGSCDFSDLTVFSFHPVKMITTAEGGMVTTNDKSLYDVLVLLRSHGVTRKAPTDEVWDGAWYYEQSLVGYNFRMSDIQAALGTQQISRLDEFLKTRRDVAQFYFENLSNFPIQLPYQHKYGRSSFHLFPILLENENERKRIYKFLQEVGIGVNVHYIPVHLQPVYKSLGFKKGDFPNAENYYSRTLSIPIHTRLSPEDLSYIVGTISKCF